MQYRILGATGLRVSEIGLGGAAFGIEGYLEPWDAGAREMDRKTAATVKRALELGYNYIDTAPAYGESERRIGSALSGSRDKVILATKISPKNWSPRGVRRSIEQSLKRLQTDWIDVVQFHGGFFFEGEEKLILENGALEELQALKREGKARCIGFTSETSSGGVQRLLESGGFDTIQVQYSIMYQHTCDFEWNQGIIPMAKSRGMGVLTMRTMTSGRFQKLMAAAFPEIPRDRVGELALRYVLSNRYVDVALVGMTSPELVERNNAVSDDVGHRFDLEALHDPRAYLSFEG